MKTIDQIKGEMDALVAGAKDEDGNARTLTAEEVTTYSGLESELQAAQASAQVLQRHAAWSAPTAGFPAVIKPQPKGDAAEMAAFSAYLRTGIPNSDLRRSTFAQTEGTPSEGGYAVPDAFRAKLVEPRTAFGGFINAGEQLTTADGRPLP